MRLLVLILAGLAAGCATVPSAGPSRSAATAAPTAEACAAASAYSAERRGVAVLVLKDGRPICEIYTGDGAADRAFPLHSGVKSFVGVMAAAAAQDRMLTLDEKVSDTITEWRSDPGRSAITIRQLLSLSSGVPGGQVGRTPTYAAAVGTQAVAAPGARFAYGPVPFQIFGEVMRRKLTARGQSGDPLAYMERRIFRPIGLNYAGWARTEGDAHLPNGAELTAREWAKFGEFVRSGGRVNGRALVDKATLDQLFTGTAANPAYGVTWWLARDTGATEVRMPGGAFDLSRYAAELPSDLAVAAGAGDQRLYVIPSRGLTVVRFAAFDVAAIMARSGREQTTTAPQRRWSDAAFLKLLLGETAD